VEEVLSAVGSRDKPETLVRDPLDRAVRRRHVSILSSSVLMSLAAKSAPSIVDWIAWIAPFTNLRFG
jgi:hypothetical protein